MNIFRVELHVESQTNKLSALPQGQFTPSPLPDSLTFFVRVVRDHIDPHVWGTGSTPLLSNTSPTSFPGSGKVVHPDQETLPDTNCLELNTIRLICPQISVHETIYNPQILRIQTRTVREKINPASNWMIKSIYNWINSKRGKMIFTGHNLSRIQLKMTTKHSATHNVPSCRTGWSDQFLITPVFYLCNFDDLQLLPGCSVFHLPILPRELFFFLNQLLVIDFQSIESVDRYCLAATTIHCKVNTRNNRALLMQDLVTDFAMK